MGAMDAGSGNPVICAYCGGPVRAPIEGFESSFCCYGCRILGAAGTSAVALSADGDGRQVESPWFRVGVGACLAGQSMLFGLAANLGQPDGLARIVIHVGLAGSSIMVLWLLGIPMIREACVCARDRRWTMEWLFLAGITGALGASVYSSLTGQGAVYYEAVSVLVTVYAAGKALTASARKRAVEETARLADCFGVACRIRNDGIEEWVSVAEIGSGDRVRVAPGGSIPVDGLILSGVAYVRETLLTGELMAVTRRVGDRVFAGGISEDGELELQATVAGSERRLDALLAEVRRVREGLGDTQAQQIADRLSPWLLPAVIAVAVATWWVWQSRGDPGGAWYHALSVLLVACPCALGLATPLALWNGLSVLAARGVVLHSARALERLAEIRSVWFDKTGTLSRPEPVLIDFVVGEQAPDRETLLGWMAAIEARSGHPLARAFAGAVRTSTAQLHELKLMPGRGVDAVLQSAGGVPMRVQVGRLEWIHPEGSIPAWAAGLRAEPDDLRVAVSIDGIWCGLAAVRESFRDGWQETVDGLRRMGCQVGVLSGDVPARLSGLALEGVEIHGSLTPLEKVAFVRRPQETVGPTLFVGDGVNDAPALGAADVGLAMGTGSALAKSVSDGLLPSSDPMVLVEVLAAARGVRRRIIGSFWFAGVYNSIGMGMAACGVLHPVAATLLMVGSSSIVAWRAVRGGVAECHEVPSRGDERLRWATAVALVAQIPLGSWLGNLGWPAASILVVVLGTLAAYTLAAPKVGVMFRMLMGMLGVGNLMMLVGWWMDAGFMQVMRDGVCLCCQSHHYFEIGRRVPWMHLGMLVGGLPAMWGGLPRWGAGGVRWPSAVLSILGMVVGMNEGADVLLRWAGPGHPAQFVMAWTGMTVGMLVGMTFACGLAEAIRVGLKTQARSPQARATASRLWPIGGRQTLDSDQCTQGKTKRS